MAGTIFGLGLSQQYDDNREPLSGALLYLYEAGTSTPVTAYEDFGLTTGLEHPWPIVLDASGRIPSFWLADGAYRVRLTDALGNEIFDENSITAIGASSGTGDGGGGVGNDQIFQTGDIIGTFTSGTRTGWVRLNGKTIGSSSSGATERAHADTQTLFEFLWANCSNTDCPVASGRGVSAVADWNANKTIGLPKMQGRGLIGHDTMGATAAQNVVADANVIGEAGGAESTSITIAKENLPDYTLPDTLTLPNHGHNDNFSISGSQSGGLVRNLSQNNNKRTNNEGGQAVDISFSETSLSISGSVGSVTSNPSISGSVRLDGGGTAIEKSLMNPYRVCTWYMKL